MGSKADFERYFDWRFITKKKTEFEDWFAHLASAIFGSDFEHIKAGGRSGDKKSDGRVISTETVYQCYAPESSSTFSKNAARKIEDSFPEVLEFWPNLKEWIFVHNNTDGLPATASDVIEKLRQQYPHLKIYTVSRRWLKDEFHDKLSLQQLSDIYDEARIDVESVEMEDVRPLIRKIIEERGSTFSDPDFGDIPRPEKIEHNKLSPASVSALRRATAHIDVVRRYLESQSDPRNASVVQIALREKYLRLKSLQYSPDEILGKMIDSIKTVPSPEQDAAALVIAAYFFDTCDIFENAPAA